MTDKEIKKIAESVPVDKISISLLKSLDYGEEVELDDEYSLCHHSEESIIDVLHTETWTGLYTVLWNHETELENSIEFERLF